MLLIHRRELRLKDLTYRVTLDLEEFRNEPVDLEDTTSAVIVIQKVTPHVVTAQQVLVSYEPKQ